MNSFKHSANERNKTNVLKLRMKHGAAGYGIYMMLLERLAAEPMGRTALNYNILAYEFRESKELIRSVVEDFDLFIIDLDGDTFANEEINRQLPKKAKEAAKETLVAEFIEHHVSDSEWLSNNASAYDMTFDSLRQTLRTTFRTEVLNVPDIPTQTQLHALLNHILSSPYPIHK